MCNNCHQTKCCCTPPPCIDCLKTETIVVRKGRKKDVCAELINSVKQIALAGRPDCVIAFGNPIISGSNVTLVAIGAVGSTEYSQDGVLWQSSPTFTNQANGTKRYYIRQMNNDSCVAVGNATVTNGSCTADWQNVFPLETECLNGKVNNRQSDGCGHFRWMTTATSCNTCVPVWQNTTNIPTTSCIGGFVNVYQSNGCGDFRWLPTLQACDSCELPTADNLVAVIEATCTGTSIINDASFSIGSINNGDRYGYSLGNTYTGPNYSVAINIVGSTINKTDLNGFNTPSTWILRIFNGSNECYIDRQFTFVGTNCSAPCQAPAFTLSTVSPTCVDGVSGLNGKIVAYGISNVDKVAICEVISGPCDPSYASGGAISAGAGPVDLMVNMSFPEGREYRDFLVRMFNGSDNCKTDHTIRFYNPCFAGTCILPGILTIRPEPNTCTDGAPNEDARIALYEMTNMNRFGYSQGTVYSGPNYADGFFTAPGTNGYIYPPGIIEVDTPFVLRFFNGSDTCFRDFHVVMPAYSCIEECVAPIVNPRAFAPTCLPGGASNNDGAIFVEGSGHANATKFQLCADDTFSCTPNYTTATSITPGDSFNILTGIGFTAGELFKDYTIRFYNGSVDCHRTYSMRLYNPCTNPCCVMTINNISLTTE